MTAAEIPDIARGHRLRIYLLGEVGVEIQELDKETGRKLGLPGGWRTQALLAYLALNGGPVSLAKVADDIWGSGASKNNVSQALSILRGCWREDGVELDEWVIHPQAGHLQLAQDDLHVTWVDVRAAEDAIEQPRKALKRLRGPLCPDVPSRPWLDAARRELAESFDGPLKRVETEALGRGDLALLRLALVRRTQLDPSDMKARRRLAELELELDARNDDRARGDLPGPGPQEMPADAENDQVPHPAIARRLSARLMMVRAPLLALFAAGGLGLMLLSGDRDPSASACPSGRWSPSRADQLATTMDAPAVGRRPTLTAEIDIDSRPTSLAVGREGIWVAGRNGLTLIDPRTNRVRGASIDIGGRGYAVALTRDRIWATRRDGFLVEVDRASRRPTGSPLRYGTNSAEVTTAAGAVWLNSYAEDLEDPINGQLIRVDPCSHRISRYRVGRIANSVRVGFGSLWITDSTNDEVIRFDPRRREVLARIASSDDPQDMAMGAGRVWVTDFYRQRIYRIDPVSNRALTPGLSIGSEPGGVAVGLGAIWTGSFANGEISRISLKTLQAKPNAARADDLLTDIAVGFGRIWVTPNGGTSVQSFTP